LKILVFLYINNFKKEGATMKTALVFFSENLTTLIGIGMTMFIVVELIYLNIKTKKETKNEAAEWLASRTPEEINRLRLWEAFGDKKHGTAFID